MSQGLCQSFKLKNFLINQRISVRLTTSFACMLQGLPEKCVQLARYFFMAGHTGSRNQLRNATAMFLTAPGSSWIHGIRRPKSLQVD